MLKMDLTIDKKFALLNSFAKRSRYIVIKTLINLEITIIIAINIIRFKSSESPLDCHIPRKKVQLRMPYYVKKHN
jgi:hypothetical protein